MWFLGLLEGLLGRLGHQEMHREQCRGRLEGLLGHLGHQEMHRGLCRERQEGLLGRLGHQGMHQGLGWHQREGLLGHLGLLERHQGLCQERLEGLLGLLEIQGWRLGLELAVRLQFLLATLHQQLQDGDGLYLRGSVADITDQLCGCQGGRMPTVFGMT